MGNTVHFLNYSKNWIYSRAAKSLCSLSKLRVFTFTFNKVKPYCVKHLSSLSMILTLSLYNEHVHSWISSDYERTIGAGSRVVSSSTSLIITG